MAERELASLGRHVTVPTFNLSTTSLRHINKWYDRLNEIHDGSHSAHPNYYSDPESLGLVEKVGTRGRLTRAGRQFLDTAPSCRNSPSRAEFELVKILYFSGLPRRPRVDEFLDGKRQNLLRLLSDCHLTSNSELLLKRPKLLAIAEALARFPGALQRFLEMRSSNLTDLEALGEGGFSRLWSEANPPIGLGRLVRKIGGDYTRAEERRLHFLIAMVLNEISQDLSRRGRLFDELRLPLPYSNLITPKYLLENHAAYTDDIRVAEEEGRILAFLNPQVVKVPAVPIVTQIGIRVPKRHAGRRGTKKVKVRQPTSRRRVIDLVMAKEAEDYLERTILKPKHGNALVRVGHTNRELQLLADGSTPGADFYVKKANSKKFLCFYEVKSALNSTPAAIRITRAEHSRAKECFAQGIPYEIYVVVFLQAVEMPKVLHIPDFATKANALALEHVVSFEIALDL